MTCQKGTGRSALRWERAAGLTQGLSHCGGSPHKLPKRAWKRASRSLREEQPLDRVATTRIQKWTGAVNLPWATSPPCWRQTAVKRSLGTSSFHCWGVARSSCCAYIPLEQPFISTGLPGRLVYLLTTIVFGRPLLASPPA